MSFGRYLFRGISKRSHNWVYWKLISGTGDSVYIVQNFAVEQTSECDVELYATDFEWVYSESVGQWTGCFDRKYNQIFEGDLIKNKQGEIGRVYLHGTGFRVSTEMSPAGFDALWWMQLHKYNPPSPEDDPTPKCDVSIIGSIHDHLLGVEK